MGGEMLSMETGKFPCDKGTAQAERSGLFWQQISLLGWYPYAAAGA